MGCDNDVLLCDLLAFIANSWSAVFDKDENTHLVSLDPSEALRRMHHKDLLVKMLSSKILFDGVG